MKQSCLSEGILKVIVCHHCYAENILQQPIPRGSECSKCSNDLRVCLNCEFYDPTVSEECRETSAEPVAVKNRGNYCEYFKPITQRTAFVVANQSDLSPLKALFGETTVASDNSADPRSDLEKLFKK